MASDRSLPLTACPARHTVARFVDGALPPAEDAALRAHLDVCATCRRLVAEIGAGGSEPLTPREVPERDGIPATRLAERDDVMGPGAVIGGKYRILRVIGTGGMGQVVAALHIELKQTVAIKLMHPDVGTDSDSVRRFLREGRSAALLRSDHAVRIIDVGRLPSGLPYLVMEYLEGEDLDSLRSKRELSVEEVADFMVQAMLAISEAHDAGLVHRDIKPQNLFLARLPDGKQRVKVLDFGLAKELPSIQSTNSALTTDNMLIGSPHYMSPEQIRTPTSVDARTDVWALGAAMFKLLTGQPPYVSGTVHGLLARILADPAPRVRERRPDVPLALEETIARCMEKDLEKRFQSVAELSAAMLAAVPPPTPSMVQQRAAPATLVDAPRTILDRDEVTVARREGARAPLEPTVDDPMPARIGTLPLSAPRYVAPTLVSPPHAAREAAADHPAPAVALEDPRLKATVRRDPTPAGSRKAWTFALVVVTLAASITAFMVYRTSVGSDAPGKGVQSTVVAVTPVQAKTASATSATSATGGDTPVPGASVSAAPPPASSTPPAAASAAHSATPVASVHAATPGRPHPPVPAAPKKPGRPPSPAGSPAGNDPANDPLYGWGK